MASVSDAVLYTPQFFDQQSAGSLTSARTVLRQLFDFFPVKSAVDVGCGVAPWLRAAMELGVARAIGLDGDYIDFERLLVKSAYFRSCDLETEDLRSAVNDQEPFDLVMCMEVAEHLSAGRAQPFIKELCSLGDLVLFSAAIPGQGGTNHVNEQWPRYWAALFEAHGFMCFDVLRSRLWDREECEWWYLQNALLFAKRDTEPFGIAARLQPRTASLPMSLVHPRMLAHTMRYVREHIGELEQLARYQPFGREEGIRQLETKIDRLRAMYVEKCDEVAASKQLVERTRAERAKLTSERDQLARELAGMQTSTSWRVTDPLRRLVTFLRR